VIKGLLKQCQNYNITAAWKDLVGWASNSDYFLEWSEGDASILKRKLEFHEGSPRETASEAHRLATSPFQQTDEPGWITPDSRVTTLVGSDILLEPERGTWLENSATKDVAESSFSSSLWLKDVETAEYSDLI
jgi:hypothetical protein